MEEEDFSFTINKDYADRYNRWREKEELQKLKDRYGDISDGSESSSETEDEDGDGLTPQVQKDWLKTLAAIKSKNPKIYDQKQQFYEPQSASSTDSDEERPSKKREKPMFLKDYDRKVILEKGGHLSDEDTSSDDDKQDREYVDEPGYYEEQEKILDSFKEVVGKEIESDSDEDLLTKREKTKQELEKEEEDYIEWLKGQKTELKDQAGLELDPLKSYWNDPSLPDGERFLRDYILNKGYKEEEEKLPTYDEIVAEDFSEEEEQLEKEEVFEHKYNFRFEDPDQEFIKKYPRTIQDSVRRKDTKRADKRKLQKDKKDKDKAKMKEEIKQLKNLKRREILDKVEQLKAIAGEEDLRLETTDLDGDFDPEEHDKLMQRVFSKQYYEQGDEDDEKPTWSDDEMLGLDVDNWDEWTPGPSVNINNQTESNQEHDNSCDDHNFADQQQPGCSYVEEDNHSDRELNATKKTRKKSKFQKVIEAKKPLFDPGTKTFERYLDEYYKLDYEDVVAGQPCRFKYRNVVANTFGLSTDEILSAKEQELNRWVSVKKMSQYRTEEDEKYDVRLFTAKGKNERTKTNIFLSLQENEDVDKTETTEEGDKGKKKRKRKKQKNKIGVDMGEISSEPKKLKLFSDETVPESVIKTAKYKSEIKEFPTASTLSESDVKNALETEEQFANTDVPFVVIDNDERNKQIKKKKEKTITSDVLTSKSVIHTDIKKEKGLDKMYKKKLKKDKSVVVTDTIKLKSETDKDKKKKKKKKNLNVMSEERLKAYGINPKRFKYTQKKVKVKKSKT